MLEIKSKDTASNVNLTTCVGNWCNIIIQNFESPWTYLSSINSTWNHFTNLGEVWEALEAEGLDIWSDEVGSALDFRFENVGVLFEDINL